MKKILWTPAHEPLPEQVEELGGEIYLLKDIAPDLYTNLVQCPAEKETLERLARTLFSLSREFDVVILPIGSPAFIFMLGAEVLYQSMQVGHTGHELVPDWDEFDRLKKKFLFAHSKRVSKEEKKEDGSVEKVSIFRHEKFF